MESRRLIIVLLCKDGKNDQAPPFLTIKLSIFQQQHNDRIIKLNVQSYVYSNSSTMTGSSS
jgi:hypothetical protein